VSKKIIKKEKAKMKMYTCKPIGERKAINQVYGIEILIVQC